MTARIVTVIGCGHVGLVVASGLAELGHDVTGLDIDASLVARLNRGECHILEPGLPELLRAGRQSRNLSFSDSYDEAIPGAEFVFLAVDTPPTAGGAADLRNVRMAARGIASSLNGTTPIVVNKSTSPVGTGGHVQRIFDNVLGERHRPSVVSNPEFLRQGAAVYDFAHPDRIVVGADFAPDAQAVADLYAGLPGEVIVTDLRTAEMIKYVANAFLASRVSFINEIARLCEYLGTEIDDVVRGIAGDKRIGGHFLRPGIGYGGSCLPKDVAALRYLGEAGGVPTPMLAAVQETNLTAKTGVVRRLRWAFGLLEGRTIAVWGLTFKGGTEDTRESPAMEVVELLKNEGAHIHAHDPALVGHPERVPRWTGLRTALYDDPVKATFGADALAILTDWPEFTKVSLRLVADAMPGGLILDGRNQLRRSDVEAVGLRYIGIGRRGSVV
jgi:UDPglucose 6-dehydrogenase